MTLPGPFAIVALASGLRDLRERLALIVVGYPYDKRPIAA